MYLDLRSALVRDGNRVTFFGLPIALHCHHYNINLQKTAEDILGAEGIELLFRAAEEASHMGFKAILGWYDRIKTTKSKLELAASVYQNCGLGVIHFQQIDPKKGRVVSTSSYHVTGWLAKHGIRSTPGCHFSRGWIAGVLEVIYDRPIGYFAVNERACKMMRKEKCIFEVKER